MAVVAFCAAPGAAGDIAELRVGLPQWQVTCLQARRYCQAARGGVSIRLMGGAVAHLALHGGDRSSAPVLVLDGGARVEAAFLLGRVMPVARFPAALAALPLSEGNGAGRAVVLPIGQLDAVVSAMLGRVAADELPVWRAAVARLRRVDAGDPGQLSAADRARARGAAAFVPRTKPQIEFAVRAQGGASVYDSTGRELLPEVDAGGNGRQPP